MYYLTTEDSFDGAHFLKDYSGKCRNIHGHRWRVVVTIRCEELKTDIQQRGMCVDFSDLKDAVLSIRDEAAREKRLKAIKKLLEVLLEAMDE